MFENVDGRQTDGRTTDAGVTGILIAHLGAFGSGELKNDHQNVSNSILEMEHQVTGHNNMAPYLIGGKPIVLCIGLNVLLKAVA